MESLKSGMYLEIWKVEILKDLEGALRWDCWWKQGVIFVVTSKRKYQLEMKTKNKPNPPLVFLLFLLLIVTKLDAMKSFSGLGGIQEDTDS